MTTQQTFVEQSANNPNQGLQVVIGLGKSGLSVVQYLHNLGYQVAVTDAGNPSLANELPNGVIQKFGNIDKDLLAQAHRIIISPGIDPYLPIFDDVHAKKTPMISDIQLFCEACQSKNIPIVAITGSNAKSTVTTLVGEMVKNAGKKVGVGGNLGTPALDLLHDAIEIAVLELSSFQLQTTTNLSAQVATILNMSPDHLDRHGDMDGYRQEKLRIFQGVKSIVINRDDSLTVPDLAVPMISFGKDSVKENYGLIVDDVGDIWLARGDEKLLHEKDVPIKGEHNLINVLSALALGESVGLPLVGMLNTVKNFVGLSHRCEFVTTLTVSDKTLDCYDDSKGTNIGSTIAGIAGLGKVYAPKGKKLAVILGGQGKGQNFAELADVLSEFVSHIYLIGEYAQKIHDDLVGANLSHNVNLQHCQTLKNAVYQAFNDVKEVDDLGVLLLSPACASFDQFSGYVQRGQIFKQFIYNI